MRRSPNLWLVAGSLCALAASCTTVDVAERKSDTSAGGVGVEGGATGDAGSPENGRGGAGGEPTRTEAGAPGRLALGIWPTFASSKGEGGAGALAPNEPGGVRASVATLALGSGNLPLAGRWDELAGATGSPRVAAWSAILAEVEPFRAAGRQVSLCIGISDRALDARPLGGAFDAPEALAAIERTIDEAYAELGDALALLCFGYEIDRFAVRVSAKDRRAFLALVEHGLTYARAAPSRPSAARVGVAVTLDSFVGGELPDVDAVTVQGDDVVVVYDPQARATSLKAPEAIGDELARAAVRLSELRADMASDEPRLILYEAGYPSSEELGSSEREQRDFYASLFAALDENRGQVSLVNLFGLDDRPVEDCEAEAAAFAGSSVSQAVRAVARCSSGLQRLEGGETKLAWPLVAAGLSRYRIP